MNNVTDGPGDKGMLTEKRPVNISVAVPAARASGWAPPPTPGLTQETVSSQKFTNDIPTSS